MNRRGFLGLCTGAIATVAISLRMSQGFPALVDGNRVMSETVGDFTYYMDLDEVTEVSIYHVSDTEHNNPISPKIINLHATYEHDQLSSFVDRSDEAERLKAQGAKPYQWHKVDTSYDRINFKTKTYALELCAIIAMSQGMAMYREEGEMVELVSGEMEYALVPLAQITT